MDTVGAVEHRSLRRENRVLAVQWAYMCQLTHRPASATDFPKICTLFEKDPQNFQFAQELVLLMQSHLHEIDALIERFATNWNFSRLSNVDLCVLRLATCELLYRPDIPPVVTINEAIELGKLFSGEPSKAFINGILDRIRGTLSRPLRTATTA
ncbi:MAG: transcription antitermination factor NusB [Verrucomicrobiota bacterium]|nr:MAG: transcription antitermination factor NusB [Verrucomicrobiota bacterium]